MAPQLQVEFNWVFLTKVLLLLIIVFFAILNLRKGVEEIEIKEKKLKEPGTHDGID